MRRASLTTWVFVGMGAGIAIGLLWPTMGAALSPVMTIFLRLIKSLIAPLLFATLVSGMASTGDGKGMGRIGLKAIVYFQFVTTVAILIGLAAAVLLRLGVGMHLGALDSTKVAAAPPIPGLISTIERVFPSSIIDAMARGEVLQIVVFSLLFGAACAAMGAKAQPIIELADCLASVMFRYANYVMYFAPLGVAAAMAVSVAQNGPRLLSSLGKFVLVTCGAELVFAAGILFPIAILTRVPLHRFFLAVREPAAIAFSTASSDSALPLALENMEGLGVPKYVAGFVLATGYSFNLAGTTLYLALASIFVAHAAGVHLSFQQQLLMMLTLMLTSKGVAAVPRASYVILVGTITAAGVPVEAAGIILGVDTLLDMTRTCVNLVGNCLATVVIARWEGTKFDKDFTIAR